ncbi:MAG: YfiR/HmsC family protein [Sulfurimonas sp.]|jgi:diguanylate cyclase (GGDEF)-like protein|nr:YfiR/HmsC family protein [Sulfurimonadaceae bacterium]
MKILLVLALFLTTLIANEIKEEQVKVAYTYSFMKNISWSDEDALARYKLLVVSQNETLKNMFKMLSSRKKLKDKNIEVVFFDKNNQKNDYQAIYIDDISLYEKLFYEYENSNTLIISDSYEDKKKVLINLFEDDGKITFEINKANIINQDLSVSPDMILLGGTEIDVAKLYQSSQDELKEQKEFAQKLSLEIERKNLELNEKLKQVEEQKAIIQRQVADISVQTGKIAEQERVLKEQTDSLEVQKAELQTIYAEIESQKQNLEAAQVDINIKEQEVARLVELQKQNEDSFKETKKILDELNIKIDEQRSNLVGLSDTVDAQKNIIFMFIALFIIILILGYLALKQQRKLKTLAEVDTLSGLYNRRYIHAKMESEIDRYKRYSTPFSVVLLDIDHFKKINDGFGHDVGDMVIQKISAILKEGVRKTDIVARWGGEEFLIVASNTALKGGVDLAESIRKKVEEFDFEFGHKVTISLGVASIQEKQNQDEIVKKADEALYEAKENGRNRVVSV